MVHDVLLVRLEYRFRRSQRKHQRRSQYHALHAAYHRHCDLNSLCNVHNILFACNKALVAVAVDLRLQNVAEGPANIIHIYKKNFVFLLRIARARLSC